MGFKLSEHQLDKMVEYGIPSHMHGALQRYYEDQIPPGGFLTAVLVNDLFGAMNRADSINSQNFEAYAMWFYNQAPSGSYGSPAAVQGWLAGTSEVAMALQGGES